MPFWAILYSMLLIAGTYYTIRLSPDKSLRYQLCETASGTFALLFFLFYYEVLPYPHTLFVPLLMLAFILFQEIWVNRALYDLAFSEGSADMTEAEQRIMLIVVPLVTILFIAPFVWVVSQVFAHYVSLP